MTNSRLTDPEVLEARYPVVLEEFTIRENSGGAGAHKGGDGTVRRIRVKEKMTAAFLSMRRETAPFGLNGGGPGARGKNFVIHANDAVEFLRGRDEVELEPGDEIVVATPGGGGYGPRPSGA
jgi:5-oxoprolinase (ATP-hydrolysing)